MGRLRLSQLIGPVGGQGGLIGQGFHAFAQLRFRGRWSENGRGGAHGIALPQPLIHLQLDLPDTFRPVLVQGAADEVELPALLRLIIDLPGIDAGLLQNLNQLFQHQPSLAFVFR